MHLAPALRAMQFATRHGLLRRGNSWILRALPSALWGGDEIEVETEIGPMRLPTRERSASALMLYGSIPHEQAESRVMAKLAENSRTMIDIGSHYGWYARLMSARCPTVIGVEPDPMTHRLASLNAPKARVLQIGLGNDSGSATLYIGKTRDLNSMVRRVGRPLEVQSKTLDALCNECGLDEVDVVKCDVEGGEVAVLRGASRLLAHPRPPIWLIEVSDAFLAEAGASAEAVAQLLSRAGGTFYGLSRAGHASALQRIDSSGTGLSNVFYVPTERSEQFHEAVRAARR
jgi:FkbM family methyltransferase